MPHSPATVTVAEWSLQTQEAIESAELTQREVKTIPCFKLTRNPSGNVGTRHDGDFTGEVDTVCHRVTKFNGKPDLDDPELIHRFFAREEDGPYFKLTDEQAWELLRRWAERERATGEEMLQASRRLNVLLILRAGISRGGKLSSLDLAYGAVS